MKKFILIGLITVFLTSCQNNQVEDTLIGFNNPIKYTLSNEVYDFEFNENDEEKYNNLYEDIKDVDLNNIVVITTSTANLLYEIGITPVGMSSSENLVDGLKDKRCNSYISIVDIMGFEDCANVENGIQIVGDGTGSNNEILTKMNPSRVFYSSSLPSNMGSTTTGVGNLSDVTAINQSDFMDPFITLQVFKKVAEDSSKDEIVNKINNLVKSMIEEVEETKVLVETFKDDVSKTVAIVQAHMGGESFLMNKDSAPGVIAYTVGLNNVFANETDNIAISIESLLSADPDYLLIVGMGGTRNEAVYELEREMANSISKFRSLKAVKNNNIITSDMSPSLDILITNHILEIAEQVYDN